MDMDEVEALRAAINRMPNMARLKIERFDPTDLVQITLSRATMHAMLAAVLQKFGKLDEDAALLTLSAMLAMSLPPMTAEDRSAVRKELDKNIAALIAAKVGVDLHGKD